MSHVFAELDGPVHGTNFSPLGIHGALSSTVRTGRLLQVFGSNFTRPGRLNHPAQLLADLVSRQLDLVEVRRLLTLIGGLQFRG